jgi:hypothetical protein
MTQYQTPKKVIQRFGVVAVGFGSMLGVCLLGCKSGPSKSDFKFSEYTSESTSQLKRSDATDTCNTQNYSESANPYTVDLMNATPETFQQLTLQECIQIALSNTKIMRDLGVSVLRSPQSVISNIDPAAVFTDPRIGEEAALSQFDANLFASTMYDKNDRRFNNQFFGQNGKLRQDLSTTQLGISKQSASGALFTVRNVAVYDRNNQTGNSFGSPKSFSWDSFMEAQVRQPLMLGAGTEFNRIAGPGATPGQLNGVLLARVRTDISLIDLEKSVRDYLADVENAYWDLYYAFRDFHARVEIREIAKATEDKRSKASSNEVGRDEVAQASEQRIRFESEVIDSLAGRLIDGTRTNNGSFGGSFRGNGGLRICERRLRLLIGLPINDIRFLQPAEKPTTAKVNFDWSYALGEGLQYREELRRQRWVIKQRELELIANRNFLKPQFDIISAYRLRGFAETYQFPRGDDLQEWSLGLDYQMPVGFRRGNASVRNSQLLLAREVEMLREQERAVLFGLSNLITEADRAFDNLQLQRERIEKIEDQLKAIEAKKERSESVALDVELETQRRYLDAKLKYFQSEVEYTVALRNVNLEKGTLLRYCNVYLHESGSSREAILDAVPRLASQDSSTPPEYRDPIIGRPADR